MKSVALVCIGLIAMVTAACGAGDEPASVPGTSATATVEPPPSAVASTANAASSADGTFTIGAGSEATFTVNEKLSSLPLPNDAVMRTGEITGEIDLSAATASIVIDLQSLRSDASRRDRYIRNQLFPRQREATINVSAFPDLPEDFAEGKSFTSTVIATVNVNGTDAEIEFSIESRLDPDRLLVLVKGDFTWADFGMSAPTSRSFVVTDNVHVEVLVSAVPK